MALPKFGPKEFRNAALGLGALALTAIPLVSGPSFAEDGKNARTTAASTVSASMTVPTEEDLNTASVTRRTHAIFDSAADRSEAVPVSDTTNTNMPLIQAATAERPYSYMRFDGQTAEQLPNATPLQAIIQNSDKLIVLNFIDERSRFSAMQSQVLQRTLTALAPRSEAKELMLMDVVVRDREGKDFYMSTYSTYYDANNLGPNGARREDAILPYGVVYGDSLREDGRNTLFDFALMNGVQNDADLNANAEGIAGSIYNVILNYNQKKLASVENNGPTLAGLQ